MKFYIAFSIAGTKSFTVATIKPKLGKRVMESTPNYIKRIFGDEFSLAHSRRFNYQETKDGIKLHWKGLVSKSTGEPMTDKGWVTRRFQQLSEQGWHVVKRQGVDLK